MINSFEDGSGSVTGLDTAAVEQAQRDSLVRGHELIRRIADSVRAEIEGDLADGARDVSAVDVDGTMEL